RVRSARPGLKRHDRIAGVVLTVEEGRFLQAVELAAKWRDLRGELGLELRLELAQTGGVLVLAPQAVVELELLGDARMLGGALLGVLLVVPEAGLAHLRLELGGAAR